MQGVVALGIELQVATHLIFFRRQLAGDSLGSVAREAITNQLCWQDHGADVVLPHDLAPLIFPAISSSTGVVVLPRSRDVDEPLRRVAFERADCADVRNFVLHLARAIPDFEDSLVVVDQRAVMDGYRTRLG
jgi:hypothetical protein